MKRPVRILHISAADSGGAYVFAENLIGHSRFEDIQSTHAVFTGKKANVRITGFRPADRLIAFLLHAWEKGIQYFYEKDASVRFKFSLGHPGIPGFIFRRLIRDSDIIHLHWINKGFIRLKHLKGIKQPVVWTCHDLWPVSGGCHLSQGCMNFRQGCGNCHFLKHPSANDLSARILRRKTGLYAGIRLTFVSPGQWMDHNVSSSAAGRGHRHVIIPNGVDTAVFRHQESNRVKPETCIGFVAANLNDGNKALYRLAQAMDLLPDKMDYRLLLIGVQKEPFGFEFPVPYEVISGVSDQKSMAELYRQMDLLVCTSTTETFPTTLMEAYCCGVKCTGFDTGGVAEILQKMDETPLPCYDVRALSERIRMTVGETPDRQALSLKAKELFGIDRTALLYRELYLGLLDDELK